MSKEIVGLGRVYVTCSECFDDDLEWFANCELCDKHFCTDCCLNCVECRIPICRGCSVNFDLPQSDPPSPTSCDIITSIYAYVSCCSSKDCTYSIERKLRGYTVDDWNVFLEDFYDIIADRERSKEER